MNPGADLRPLQILQDRYRATDLRRKAPQVGNDPGVLDMSPVRKIEAGHIHPRFDKITQAIPTHRADRTDDFSAPFDHYLRVC